MSDEACYADDIGDYRWEGFPLEQKLAWMQNAPGSAAVQPGVDALRGLSARYAESHRTVQAGLAKLGIIWQGQSAEAAGQAVTRLADWVGGAGQTVSGGGGSMGTYGASFDAMRSRISPPAPMPAMPRVGPRYQPADGAGALAGLQTAIRQQAEATAAADAQANAALRAHQQATRAALSSFPLVDPPPEVVAGAVSTSLTDVASGRAVPSTGGGSVAPPRARRAGAAAGGGAPTGGPPGPGSATGGAGAGGAGHHGAGPGQGGTTSAGAGAGAGAGAPTPAAEPGWTPLSPAPGAGSGGLMTGPNGGLVPASIPPPYRSGAGAGGSTGLGRFGPNSGGPARQGGSGSYEVPPPPRTGGPGTRFGGDHGGDFGVPRNTAGRGGGPTGAAPMGMGGGARAGEERSHHNQTFIPSDEPFRVEFFDVSPPVLGVRPQEAW